VGDGLLFVMNIISEFRIFKKSLEYLPRERHIWACGWFRPWNHEGIWTTAGIHASILNIGTIWRWFVRFEMSPLFPRQRSPHFPALVAELVANYLRDMRSAATIHDKQEKKSITQLNVSNSCYVLDQHSN